MKRFQTDFPVGGIHYFAKWEQNPITDRIKIIELSIIGVHQHDITSIIMDDRLVADQFHGVLEEMTKRINAAETLKG